MTIPVESRFRRGYTLATLNPRLDTGFPLERDDILGVYTTFGYKVEMTSTPANAAFIHSKNDVNGLGEVWRLPPGAESYLMLYTYSYYAGGLGGWRFPGIYLGFSNIDSLVPGKKYSAVASMFWKQGAGRFKATCALDLGGQASEDFIEFPIVSASSSIQGTERDNGWVRVNTRSVIAGDNPSLYDAWVAIEDNNPIAGIEEVYLGVTSFAIIEEGDLIQYRRL